MTSGPSRGPSQGKTRCALGCPPDGVDVMHRQIAGKLTGPVTKWLVLGFWIIVVVVASGYAAKLSDVQDNQAQSWLPSSAESTKALDKLAPFQDENDIPTTIVYHRSSGITDADLATIA